MSVFELFRSDCFTPYFARANRAEILAWHLVEAPYMERRDPFVFRYTYQGECAFSPRAFARSDLYHFPEGIVSFARRDCIFCPKGLYLLPEGIVSFARFLKNLHENETPLDIMLWNTSLIMDFFFLFKVMFYLAKSHIYIIYVTYKVKKSTSRYRKKCKNKSCSQGVVYI